MKLSVLPAGEFPLIVKCWLAAENKAEAHIIAQKAGAPDRVVNILNKADVGGLSSTDWPRAPGAYAVMGAFFASLRSASVFFRMLDDAAFSIAPLKTRVFTSAVAIAGKVLSEGQLIPVKKIQLNGPELARRKAGLIVVANEELVNDMSAEANNLLSREIRSGVVAAVDNTFLSEIVVSETPVFQSSGSTAAEILSDLYQLLNSVNTKGAGALYFVASADVANVLSTCRTDLGNHAFPGVGPKGGELLNLPLLVTDQISAGSLALVDAGGFAANAESVNFDTSNQAALVMSDTPDESPAEFVSMFQAHSIALKMTVNFGFEETRSGSVAILENIEAIIES